MDDGHNVAVFLYFHRTQNALPEKEKSKKNKQHC